MKFVLLILLMSGSAFSYEGFHCIPSLRQTRIQVLVKEKNIELLVVNPDGYDFMPQFDSGAKFSLAFNKMQAEDLKDFSDAFIYTWPREKCNLDASNFTVNCSGEAINKVQAIKSYGISTTEVTEKTHGGEIYEKRKFRLSAEKDNMYFVNLEFYKQNCESFQ